MEENDLKKEIEALKAENETLKNDLETYKKMYRYAEKDLARAKEYLKAIGVTVVTMTKDYM